MNNNAIINTRLEELFKILDARAFITIFIKRSDNTEELLRSTNLYTLLADNEFLGAYNDYNVIGLTVILGRVSLLIKEA